MPSGTLASGLWRKAGLQGLLQPTALLLHVFPQRQQCVLCTVLSVDRLYTAYVSVYKRRCLPQMMALLLLLLLKQGLRRCQLNNDISTTTGFIELTAWHHRNNSRPTVLRASGPWHNKWNCNIGNERWRINEWRTGGYRVCIGM